MTPFFPLHNRIGSWVGLGNLQPQWQLGYPIPTQLIVAIRYLLSLSHWLSFPSRVFKFVWAIPIGMTRTPIRLSV